MWVQVAEEWCRGHRYLAWRCRSCRAWAVTSGEDPGRCLRCLSRESGGAAVRHA